MLQRITGHHKRYASGNNFKRYTDLIHAQLGRKMIKGGEAQDFFLGIIAWLFGMLHVVTGHSFLSFSGVIQTRKEVLVNECLVSRTDVNFSKVVR